MRVTQSDVCDQNMSYKDRMSLQRRNDLVHLYATRRQGLRAYEILRSKVEQPMIDSFQFTPLVKNTALEALFSVFLK